MRVGFSPFRESTHRSVESATAGTARKDSKGSAAPEKRDRPQPLPIRWWSPPQQRYTQALPRLDVAKE